MRHRILVNKLILVITLTVVFLSLAIPFKVMVLISGFTEIRPANALNMLFGIMYGFYGALACSIGNIIADICGGTLTISSWAGFVANFLGTYLVHIIWYAIAKEEPIIDSARRVIIYIFTTITVGVIIASIVTFGVKLSYGNIEGISLFLQVFLNMVGFSVVLGMPLLIILKTSYGVKGIIPKKYKDRKKDNA